MQTERPRTQGIPTANSNALYLHRSVQKAYSYLQYALYNGEGLMLITGEPGTGKTALLTHLLREHTQQEQMFTAIDCARFSGEELLQTLAEAWSINDTGNPASPVFQGLQNYLIQQYRFGKRSVLLLDEAQFLTDDALEVVRLLGNLSIDGNALLQIVLVGQPALRARLLHPQFTQLHQRIIATCNLDPLSEDETRTYAIQQLRKAGWQHSDEIPASIFTAIHPSSQGIPRWINLICNRMMIQAIANERLQFSLEDICLVLQELVGEDLLPEQFRHANRPRTSALPSRPPATGTAPARLEVAA